ncbi:transketolase C-terminal domain-containing protein [Nocardioides bigeumensis]|uniref:Pyruvate synthase subunit PorA n=1 Tax=Nocardioides bigeumensis TaxID=433657 RepID=A0ABP5JX11_9ACTN
MRDQMEGSVAVATAVARCRPQVVAAYPISPQTHIVEGLADLVRTGALSPCEYLLVESEFAAMSACIGASAAGVRAYTASSSQGLLFMAEALFNASGLGLPVVMTVANRAIGAPINIWNDHSDTMALRDAGWIQLYAATNQEAADLHVLAFRVAETVSLPVMVCMDGFVLTHAFEEVDVPDQDGVDRYLPAFRARQQLDPGDPMSIGALVGPEAFMEAKLLVHARQLRALDLLPRLSGELAAQLERRSAGLLDLHRLDDAETVLVGMGSVLGTLQAVADASREDGDRVGVLGVTCFRPWPAVEVRQALERAQRVVVVEKALSIGAGGVLGQDVRVALEGLPVEVHDVVAGLGGRPVGVSSVGALLHEVLAGRLDARRPHFLDVNASILAAELDRSGDRAEHGPELERFLADLSGPDMAGRVS